MTGLVDSKQMGAGDNEPQDVILVALHKQAYWILRRGIITVACKLRIDGDDSIDKWSGQVSLLIKEVYASEHRWIEREVVPCIVILVRCNKAGQDRSRIHHCKNIQPEHRCTVVS